MKGGRGGGCIGAMQVKWQVMGRGQAGNKCSVFFGGFADAVVHVDHGKYDAQRGPLLEQAPQQGHGIGAPETATAIRCPGRKRLLRRVGGGACMAAPMLCITGTAAAEELFDR